MALQVVKCVRAALENRFLLTTRLPNISFMIERVLLIVKIPTDHNGIGFGTLGVMVSEIFEVLYPKK